MSHKRKGHKLRGSCLMMGSSVCLTLRVLLVSGAQRRNGTSASEQAEHRQQDEVKQLADSLARQGGSGVQRLMLVAIEHGEGNSRSSGGRESSGAPRPAKAA